MPLESANSISELDVSWPSGGDTVDKGDDHIRLIKSVLKKQFPGFNKPLSVTVDYLNSLEAKIRQLETSITGARPIGTLEFRVDAVNPGTLFGGTWTLITGDATLALGDGTANVGTISGNNTPSVPLPKHNHTGNTSINGNHNHKGAQFYVATGFKSSGSSDHSTPYNSGNQGIPADGDHQHTFTTADSGVDNPTIDVRGARIKINVWKRTA